jgi:hypothetical protein
MKGRKRAARLLGLLAVAALGAMAFAASAQAAAPGFLINKKPVGALLAKATGVQEGVGTMRVPTLNFELNCTAFTVDEGAIESNTDAKFILLYTGCTTLSISKLPEELHCHVQEPIKVEALLLPAELTNDEQAVLAEKIKALVLLHLKGTSKLQELPCALPLDSTIKGEVCFAITNNDTSLPLVLAHPTIVQCKERPSLEALTEVFGGGVKDALVYGIQPATLEAAALLSLTGAHNGVPLGVSLY